MEAPMAKTFPADHWESALRIQTFIRWQRKPVLGTLGMHATTGQSMKAQLQDTKSTCWDAEYVGDSVLRKA